MSRHDLRNVSAIFFTSVRYHSTLLTISSVVSLRKHLITSLSSFLWISRHAALNRQLPSPVVSNARLSAEFPGMRALAIIRLQALVRISTPNKSKSSKSDVVKNDISYLCVRLYFFIFKYILEAEEPPA